MTHELSTRCGIIALVGAPNAGKSTLTNYLVGSKVSIVTHKPQTTRNRVRGIAMEGVAQLILVDTPGIFEAKERFEKAMVAAAWDAALDADSVVVLVDAVRGLSPLVEQIMSRLKSLNKKAILALNKIDCVPKDQLLSLSQNLFESGVFTDVFMISARTGNGVERLKTFLADHSPQGPWLFPEDQLADVTERFLAAEITREKIFERIHQEVPYGLMVTTQAWEDFDNGSVKIHQSIVVERDAHKRIILGQGGAQLKAIGAAARRELGRLLDRPVHLFLHVKVDEGWANHPAHYRDLGLEFGK